VDTVRKEDVPAPLSWWLDASTGQKAVVVRADASEVVTRPPLGVPSCRSGPPLLAECNRPVPFSAWEPGEFLSRFVRAERPLDATPPRAA
jgi:hypothetical protein